MRRLDLRTSTCSPYLPVEDQGTAQDCVSRSFALALYCTKTGGGRLFFRSTGEVYADAGEIYRRAGARSWDSARGTSFKDTIDVLRQMYAPDVTGRSFVFLDADPSKVKRCLEGGAVVVAGYRVTELMDRFHKDANTCRRFGYVLPSEDDGKIVGGHCVVIVGYDDHVSCFICRNTWGHDWGVDGHFLVRYGAVVPKRFTDLCALVEASD